MRNTTANCELQLELSSARESEITEQKTQIYENFLKFGYNNETRAVGMIIKLFQKHQN